MVSTKLATPAMSARPNSEMNPAMKSRKPATATKMMHCCSERGRKTAMLGLRGLAASPGASPEGCLVIGRIACLGCGLAIQDLQCRLQLLNDAALLDMPDLLQSTQGDQSYTCAHLGDLPSQRDLRLLSSVHTGHERSLNSEWQADTNLAPDSCSRGPKH